MINKLRESLNSEQYAAATAGDGPLLVLAAAGTGKTHTLVSRVAYLVSRGVAPSSILLLTFTNKAAKEMLERAQQTIGPAVDDIWSGTFHHVCNRILRFNAQHLGYPQNFVIADRDDCRSLVDRAMKQHGLVGGEKFPKRDVLLSLFGNAVSRNVDLEQVVHEKLGDTPIHPADVVRVFDTYTQMKFDDGIMDFDDLLINCVRLFELKPEVLDFYKRKFSYILVDEFQDTNTIQSAFVDMLAGAGGNLMAVGDDFQCIYSWRGANFRNILDFQGRHPGAQIIKLESNYRSTPEVLDLANACIAHNVEQFQKTLRPTRTHGSKPMLYMLRNAEDQSQGIIRKIREYQQQGRKLSDMVVLYRSHYQSIELQMMLAKARISFTVTSGLGVFETAHAKDLLSILRILQNPKDFLAFERFFTIFPGLGAITVRKIWEKMERSCNLSQAADRIKLTSLLKPAARGQWEPISKAVEGYFAKKEETGKEAVVSFVQNFLDVFYTSYLTKEYENPNDRVDDILEIARQIEVKGSLELFLQDVALMTGDDTGSEQTGKEGDLLRLSTVHQAKGLEWPIVFIIWLCDDMFPSPKSLDDGDEEERRLFYVAVTRAKENLLLFSPQQRRGYDNYPVPCKPSRFVKEVPQTLMTTRFGVY